MGNRPPAGFKSNGDAHGDYDAVPPASLHLNEAALSDSMRLVIDAYSASLKSAMPSVLPHGLQTRACFSSSASEAECNKHGGMYAPVPSHPLLTRLNTFLDSVKEQTRAAQRLAADTNKRLAQTRDDLFYLERVLMYLRGFLGESAMAHAALTNCQERVVSAKDEVKKAQAALDALHEDRTHADVDVVRKVGSTHDELTRLLGGDASPYELAGGDTRDAYRAYQALMDGQPVGIHPDDAVCVRTYPNDPEGDAQYAAAQAAGFACAPTLFGLRIMGPFTRGLRAQLALLHAAKDAAADAHEAIGVGVAHMTSTQSEIERVAEKAGLTSAGIDEIKEIMHQTQECTEQLNQTLQQATKLQHAVRAAEERARVAQAAAAHAQAHAASVAVADSVVASAVASGAGASGASGPAQVVGASGASGPAQVVGAALASSSNTEQRMASAELLHMIQRVVAEDDEHNLVKEVEETEARVPRDLKEAAGVAAQNVLFLRNFVDAFFAAVFTPSAPEVADKDAYMKRAGVQNVILREPQKRKLIVNKALTFDGSAALVSKALRAYMESAGMRRLHR
jgi:hypothetical protein